MAQKSTEIAGPCDKCRYTDCASLHDNVAPHCGLQICGMCSSVAQINDEISETHNKLIELIKQRRALKTQFNNHHERPIDRLPFELIAKIFILCFLYYDDFPYYGHWTPVRIPLALGAVCRSWRNVTLGISRLWTAVKFRVKYGAPSYHFNVAKKWVDRSGTLPLSVMINLQSSSPDHRSSKHTTSFDAMIALIRSHSTRWGRINIQSSHASHIHKLLDNLKLTPNDLEYLSIASCEKDGLQSFNSQSAVILPRSFSQFEAYYTEGVNLWDIPCGYERLTSIDLANLPVDEVLYFIQHAPILKECKALFIESFDSQNHSFLLPNVPIIARSVTHLEISTSSEILQHLTLPSLETLDHDCDCMSSQNNGLDILATFLQRSSPPLLKFNLTVRVWYDEISTWYEILPTITSLRVEASKGISSGSDSRECIITEDFLAALTRTGPAMVLPNIEYLSLTTRGMSPASWTSLCNIFQGYPKSTAAQSLGQSDSAVQVAVGHERLKKIQITLTERKWERYLSVEDVVSQVFENLKNAAGIELTVYALHGPKFGESFSS